MRGFYFENHNNLKIVSGTSHNLIGHLDLEAGSYMVWGKLSLGVNVASGFALCSAESLTTNTQV